MLTKSVVAPSFPGFSLPARQPPSDADLIERAQFAENGIMYRDGAFPELRERNFQGSWLDWFLKEIETFHGVPHYSSGVSSF